MIHIRILAFLGALLMISAAHAVQDGQGTNIIAALKVDKIQIGDEAARTNWPKEFGSVGGGPLDMAIYSNQPVWTPVFQWDGTFGKAQMQVDNGSATVQVIRSPWNAAWDSYTVLNELTVTTSGVEDSTWTSSWISNDYRLGVLVTDFTGGTGLWWSVTYSR